MIHDTASHGHAACLAAGGPRVEIDHAATALDRVSCVTLNLFWQPLQRCSADSAPANEVRVADSAAYAADPDSAASEPLRECAQRASLSGIV